ncbi:hypothetical protein AAC387_Pa05g2437 [Persea americana]
MGVITCTDENSYLARCCRLLVFQTAAPADLDSSNRENRRRFQAMFAKGLHVAEIGFRGDRGPDLYGGAIALEKWRPVAKQRIRIYSQCGPSRADPDEVEKSKKKRP